MNDLILTEADNNSAYQESLNDEQNTFALLFHFFFHLIFRKRLQKHCVNQIPQNDNQTRTSSRTEKKIY